MFQIEGFGQKLGILHEEFPKQTSSHILDVFFKNSGVYRIYKFYWAF